METKTFEIQNEIFDLQSYSTQETETPKQKM